MPALDFTTCFTPVDFSPLVKKNIFLNLAMLEKELSRTTMINHSKPQKMSLRSLTVQMFKMRVKELNSALSKSGDNNDLEAVIHYNKLAFIGKRILQILLGNPAEPLGLQGWMDSLSYLWGIF